MLYRKILFYYSLLLSSLLSFWVLFFQPKPQSFIALLIFLPIPLHFWFTIVHPHRAIQSDTQADVPFSQKNSLRIGAVILATLFISTLSIFIYSLAYEKHLGSRRDDTKTQNNSRAGTDTKAILDKLSELELKNDNILRQVERIVGNQEEQPRTLGVADETNIEATPESGFIKPNSLEVNVNRARSAASDIVGVIVAGKVYPFTDKVNGWYEITLPDAKVGWVDGQFVEEI